jgi:RNA 3'-terminal phosphate cyclase (ATP)
VREGVSADATPRAPVVLDGRMGEGGGQVLRSALALSLGTGRPFAIEGIRAGRPKPGLLRQHLTAVQAAQVVGAAEVEGAEMGSRRLSFRPTGLLSGTWRFPVGTAGSTALVLQALLPPLLRGAGPSEVVVEGGTHAKNAPPFEFLARALLPLLRRIGARVEATIERVGFHPAGGGRVRVRVEPAPAWTPLDLSEAGPRRAVEARALFARLPRDVAPRELAVVAKKLGWPPEALHAEERRESPGPGNAVVLVLEHEHVTEVFSAFGSPGISAESVAGAAAEEAKRWLRAGAPVGPHLADQLMVPLALAAGGTYGTSALTPHARTNLDVLRLFLGPAAAEAREVASRAVEVRIAPPPPL